MLSTLVMLAAAITLPASPRSVAVGDVDSDGKAEIAVLLVWDRWGSISENVSEQPGVMEFDLKPAITEKRELRIYEVDNDTISLSAEPMEVGKDLLALDADDPRGVVVALTNDGPRRLDVVPVVSTEDDEARAAIRLEPLADVAPIFAGSDSVVSLSRFVFSEGLSGETEIHLPTAEGLAIVTLDGAVRTIRSPLVDVRSGLRGVLQTSLPRFTDADGDGTNDLVASNASRGGFRSLRPQQRVTFWKGLGGGRLAPPVTWRIDAALRLTDAERAASQSRAFLDALDVDADGDLELAIAVQSLDSESLSEAFDSMRGRPAKVLFYSLGRDGRVSAQPESTTDLIGHFFPLDHPNGFRSPFLDLDGDGRAELVSFTIAFGYFGALKALASKRAKFKVKPVIRTKKDGSFEELPGAMPTVVFKQDLRSDDLSRFFDWKGDLNGDSINEFVEFDRDEVRIRRGRPGPTYAARADVTIPLRGPVGSFLGTRFVDLDGDGDSDLIAFEPLERTPEEPSRRVRLEVLALELGR